MILYITKVFFYSILSKRSNYYYDIHILYFYSVILLSVRITECNLYVHTCLGRILTLSLIFDTINDDTRIIKLIRFVFVVKMYYFSIDRK